MDLVLFTTETWPTKTLATNPNLWLPRQKQFWNDKTVFKMREMGFENTYDAGVNSDSRINYYTVIVVESNG